MTNHELATIGIFITMVVVVFIWLEWMDMKNKKANDED